MKKIAKLSLVAAVAVAGLTSTASAASLEESIKGVDVSGMIRYRYDDTRVDKGESTQVNDYDAELTVKVPVNDQVKAIAKIDVAADLDDNTGDDKATIKLEDVYFSYNAGFATINAGKQNIPGPLTDGDQGTGVVALIPVGPVTLAAGYFNNHSVSKSHGLAIDKGANAIEVAVLGSVGPVSFEAWYADVKDTAKVFNVAASGEFGPVALSASHAELDVDALKGDKNDFFTTKVEVEAGIDMFTLAAGYAKNGKAGTGELADGNDAGVNDFGGEQVDITSGNDMDMWKVGVSADVTSQVNVGLDYISGEDGAKVDYTETLLSGSYKMSKNFKISSFYSIAEGAEGKKVDSNKGRLELKYTF